MVVGLRTVEVRSGSAQGCGGERGVELIPEDADEHRLHLRREGEIVEGVEAGEKK